MARWDHLDAGAIEQTQALDEFHGELVPLRLEGVAAPEVVRFQIRAVEDEQLVLRARTFAWPACRHVRTPPQRRRSQGRYRRFASAMGALREPPRSGPIARGPCDPLM